ncbi:extracellular solute-binding protein family 3 (plasmid) [Rhizobium leguminosarum bv. trifolii WSM2304]|uniref:Extracellular solute-binding protein family 3 n=1 Tax=Rhizobium leguminosarum bv. trifolii (strain WSM2304) TaxID=395492 RepID=A0ABF7QVS4_RHILW|nr:transporter substrate-binding domain-containing protein [Rhizobium leguminosarum]ACI58285.1 extracellular solute-binding protein family 3 [Rhizobium leguminosarum bv. trifolii WSM2304]
MKHWGKAVILAATMLAGNANAEIRFGIVNEAYPPYTTKDASGKSVGWEIDLMDAVCEQLKEKCTIVDVAWDGLIPALESNKIDVIWSSMSITDERKKRIDFTDKYYSSMASMAGPRDGVLGVDPEHLKDKTVGIAVSTTQSAYFKKHFADIATEKSYATVDESFQDLASGRVDYVFADTGPLKEFLKTDLGKDCCEFKGTVPPDDAVLGAGVGGGVRKGDNELREKLNGAIKAIRANGKYAEFNKKYFDYDPY